MASLENLDLMVFQDSEREDSVTYTYTNVFSDLDMGCYFDPDQFQVSGDHSRVPVAEVILRDHTHNMRT